jgi:subtilase family serine protease
MVASQPMRYQSRHFASMWLRSFILDYLDVWVKSSIRRCYQERTNDVRYAVMTVQYFSLLFLTFTFCNFPDWFDLAVDPQPFLCLVLANTPASQSYSGLSEVASHVVSVPVSKSVNSSFWMSPLERAIRKTIALPPE